MDKQNDTNGRFIAEVKFSQERDRKDQKIHVTLVGEDDKYQIIEMVAPNPIENSYELFAATRLTMYYDVPCELGKVRVAYAVGDDEFEFWCESVEPIE